LPLTFLPPGSYNCLVSYPAQLKVGVVGGYGADNFAIMGLFLFDVVAAARSVSWITGW
jgi:hypothetical protein